MQVREHSSVKNPFVSKDVSEPMRRRVELAIAVAQERILSTHVDHVLNLIQLVGNQVPFENALAIYTRLLRLSEDEARVITTRALAIMGERANKAEAWPELITEAEAQESTRTGGGRSLMKNVRQRLRGRVNEDLRRFVELAAARTEVSILETHVDNALGFVEMLEKELPFTEAVELYLEGLDVRDSIAEVAYYMALSRLADKTIPEPKPTAGHPGSAQKEPLLRVVENEASKV
jgi:hypothetical protein